MTYPALTCPACGSFRIHTCGVRALQVRKATQPKPATMPKLACDDCMMVYSRDGTGEPEQYSQDFVDTVLFRSTQKGSSIDDE